MNQPLDDKNLAYWNDQPLDTWRDIIVSFEYSRYAVDITPTGGFAVVFFDSITNQPRKGGRDYSLGYAPNNILDYCIQGGYDGLEAGFLGIGFDNYGYFALKQPYMSGIPVSGLSIEPTVAIRDNKQQGYKLLYHSALSQLVSGIDGAQGFTVGQNVSSTSDVKTRAVRVILSKAGTQLQVQVKDNPDNNDFVNLITYNLPFRDRTSVKVGLTHTTTEGRTMFNVKNFNVAGFPGIPTTRRLVDCEQIIAKTNYAAPGILSMGDEYIATAEPGKTITYTSDTYNFNFKNNIYSGGGTTLLGDDGVNIISKLNNTSTALVYTYLGEKLFKTAALVTPDSSEVTSADIDKTNLVLCTNSLSGNAFIYTLNENINTPAIYGTWQLYQTINANHIPNQKAGIIGNSVQIKGSSLLIGDNLERVHAFRKDLTNTWTYVQTISSPLSGAVLGDTQFGKVIALEENDAVIGAPISPKESYNNPGQGETYHYVYNPNTNTWNLVMAMGNFYLLNTPGGNFGSSIQMQGDYCIVGSPGETYVLDETLQTQITNVGRAYIFRKTPQGIYSQAAVITPPASIRQEDMFFGTEVAVNGELVGILSPFNSNYKLSYLSLYRLDCEFPGAPVHLPIPSCALKLIDNSGFIIDLINNTYMVSYSCLLGNP